MDKAGFVVAFLALALSVITWQDSRRSASRANDAADRAAKASERSAAAAERQVDLVTPPPVAFRLTRSESRFTLTNTGTERATGVTMDPWQFPVRVDGRPDGLTIERDAAAQFSVVESLQAQLPASLSVRCNELPEPVWLPVPPRR